MDRDDRSKRTVLAGQCGQTVTLVVEEPVSSLKAGWRLAEHVVVVDGVERRGVRVDAAGTTRYLPVGRIREVRGADEGSLGSW